MRLFSQPMRGSHEITTGVNTSITKLVYHHLAHSGLQSVKWRLVWSKRQNKLETLTFNAH